MVLNPKVLLIADDLDTGQVWAGALRLKGIEVCVLSSTEDALSWRSENTCELIIVDVSAPGFPYIELIERLRGEATIPILLLLPGPDEAQAVAAYEVGVDECVEKPIGPRLFLAKVRAWLSRAWSVPAELLDGMQAGRFRIDPAQRQVVTDTGEAIQLTNLEFRVLHLLMSNPDQVLVSEIIVDRVWGSIGGDSTLLKNVIYRLRRKIEPDPGQPRYIVAVTGRGYVFHPSDYPSAT